jgi:quercetin dioxygenase-like cupin family protein
METKYNEATLNRPKGERIVDAPFVFTDIKKFSKQLRDEKAWRKNDRNGITVYKTDDFTMVLTWLHKDAVIMDNLVGGLISIQVLKGSIDFTVQSGKTRLEKRQIITIHTGVMHTIRALEDTLILIITKGND